MAVEKSCALSSSSFLPAQFLLRYLLGHQPVPLMSCVFCVGLTTFLLHRTFWALHPAVSVLDERRGGHLVQARASFFFEGLNSIAGFVGSPVCYSMLLSLPFAA